MKKILFVCSGNTCRSPLAEGIASKTFSNTSDLKISSAGTSALDGLPASSLAVEVAKKNSIDLSSHKARLLSRTLVKEADLIVTMSSKHRETVGVIEPAALAYTCLLTDFSDEEEGDIVDPIGMGMAAYEATYSMIDKCVSGMKKKVEKFEGWKE